VRHSGGDQIRCHNTATRLPDDFCEPCQGRMASATRDCEIRGVQALQKVLLSDRLLELSRDSLYAIPGLAATPCEVQLVRHADPSDTNDLLPPGGKNIKELRAILAD
jgi:hypothetical protein